MTPMLGIVLDDLWSWTSGDNGLAVANTLLGSNATKYFEAFGRKVSDS